MAKVEGVTVFDKDYDLVETTDLNTTMQKFEDALGANDIDKTNVMEGGIIRHNLALPNTAFTTGHQIQQSKPISGILHINTNDGDIWNISNTYNNSNASSFTTIATSGGVTSEQLFNGNTGFSLKQFDVMRANFSIAIFCQVGSSVTAAADDIISIKMQYATTNDGSGTLGGYTDFVTAGEVQFGGVSNIVSDQNAARSITAQHYVTANWSGIKILGADDIIYGTRMVIKCDADAVAILSGWRSSMTVDRRSGSS
jgi:hypothetical protein